MQTPPANNVILTFDDGPDEVWTPEILHVLEELGATASFFVQGPLVLAHPELVRSAVAAGNSVHPHCWAHVSHDALRTDQIEDDLSAVLDALASVGVGRPRFWRPPVGIVTSDTEVVAASVGLQLVPLGLNSYDFRLSRTADVMLSALEPQLAPGSLVTMHDSAIVSSRDGERTECSETVRLVRALGSVARRRAWKLTSLG